MVRASSSLVATRWMPEPSPKRRLQLSRDEDVWRAEDIRGVEPKFPRKPERLVDKAIPKIGRLDEARKRPIEKRMTVPMREQRLGRFALDGESAVWIVTDFTIAQAVGEGVQQNAARSRVEADDLPRLGAGLEQRRAQRLSDVQHQPPFPRRSKEQIIGDRRDGRAGAAAGPVSRGKVADHRQPANFRRRGGVERSADRSRGGIVKAEHADFRKRDIDPFGKIAEEFRQLLRK
jgi:hypothetical protein